MDYYPKSLPVSNTDLLAGQSKAHDVAEKLICAYWLHGRNDKTALFLLRQAHENLAELANAMGYTIAPKPADDGEDAQ